MQVNSSDFLCCADGAFVCPGSCKAARLDKTEGLKMHSAQLFLILLTFLSCIFFASKFPIDSSLFLFLSRTPRPITVKSDGQRVNHKCRCKLSLIHSIIRCSNTSIKDVMFLQLVVGSPESFFCVVRCILQMYKLPTASTLESFTKLRWKNISDEGCHNIGQRN